MSFRPLYSFQSTINKLDMGIVYATFFLIIAGMVMSLSTSPAMASRLSYSSFFFAKRHFIFSIIAILTFVFVASMSYENMIILSGFGFVFFLALTFATTFFIGQKINGSQRWISILWFKVQPSEFVKIFFAIFNAKILATQNKTNPITKYLISFFVLCMCVSCIALQPDFGTSIILISIWLVQIFICGLHAYFFVISCAVFLFFGTFSYFYFDHVNYRISQFFLGKISYQANKSLQSLSNGKFFGKGLGEGEIKYDLPESHCDYIFAVIGEEMGYVACALIIFTYFGISFYIMYKYMFTTSKFYQMLAFGCASTILVQVLINIGASINLLPSKGTTLPLISYGGSSSLAFAALFGILSHLSKKRSSMLYDSNPRL